MLSDMELCCADMQTDSTLASPKSTRMGREAGREGSSKANSPSLTGKSIAAVWSLQCPPPPPQSQKWLSGGHGTSINHCSFFKTGKYCSTPEEYPPAQQNLCECNLEEFTLVWKRRRGGRRYGVGVASAVVVVNGDRGSAIRDPPTQKASAPARVPLHHSSLLVVVLRPLAGGQGADMVDSDATKKSHNGNTRSG